MEGTLRGGHPRIAHRFETPWWSDVENSTSRRRVIVAARPNRCLPMRVLVVEDDPMIGEAVVAGLAADGYAVDWVRDASSAEWRLVKNDSGICWMWV